MSELKPQEIRGIAAQSGCRIMIENGTGHELYCFNSLTEFADNLLSHAARRTQPEATGPAQDLSAAILALPLPDAWFRSMKRGGMLSEDGYSLAQVQELLKAAAALASSANALSAGDRVDALIALLRKALEESVIGRGSYGLTYDGNLLARDIRSAILQSQNEGSHD